MYVRAAHKKTALLVSVTRRETAESCVDTHLAGGQTEIVEFLLTKNPKWVSRECFVMYGRDEKKTGTIMVIREDQRKQ